MDTEKDSFLVRGTTGNQYQVRLGVNPPTCTCPDFQKRHQNCKHIYFVKQRRRVNPGPAKDRKIQATPMKRSYTVKQAYQNLEALLFLFCSVGALCFFR
jgi:uncharacterized Zn finger protein